MPAPAMTAVYVVGSLAVVAGVIAFKEFVYEPHIAPKLEAWAESFVENRRRQRARRRGPIPADPVDEHGDENHSRRSSGSRNVDSHPRPPFPSRADDNDGDGRGMSVELEHLVAHEARASGDDGMQDGLRYRRTAGAMDENNVSIPYRPISPTHVISDSSTSPTSTSPSSSTRLRSPRGAATPAMHSLSRSRPSSVDSRGVGPIPPTPVSIRSAASSRIQSPYMMSAMSSRSSSPDVPAMYNTALMGSIGNVSDRAITSPQSMPGSRVQPPLADYQLAAPVPSLPASRIQSPFSDIHAAAARSPTLSARSGALSPFSQLSEPVSDFDLPSDSEDEVMSLRSEMFSPSMSSRQEDLAFDVLSMHGSEGSSLGSEGRRTPDL